MREKRSSKKKKIQAKEKKEKKDEKVRLNSERRRIRQLQGSRFIQS